MTRFTPLITCLFCGVALAAASSAWSGETEQSRLEMIQEEQRFIYTSGGRSPMRPPLPSDSTAPQKVIEEQDDDREQVDSGQDGQTPPPSPAVVRPRIKSRVKASASDAVPEPAVTAKPVKKDERDANDLGLRVLGVFGDTGHELAIINGGLYAVGDVVDTAPGDEKVRVESISWKEIVIISGEKRHRLPVPKSK